MNSWGLALASPALKSSRRSPNLSAPYRLKPTTAPGNLPRLQKHLNSSHWKRNSLQAKCKTKIDLRSTKKARPNHRAVSEEAVVANPAPLQPTLSPLLAANRASSLQRQHP